MISPTRRMTRGRKALGCCVVLWLLTGCNARPRSADGLTALESSVHDFGSCPQGKSLTHTFTLANQSSRTIRIYGIESSCGCLVAGKEQGLGDAILPVDGRFPLPVAFTPAADDGTASGRIYVSFSEKLDKPSFKDMRRIALTVNAYVQPNYRISPHKLDLGEIDGLRIRKLSRSISFQATGAKPVEVRKVETSSDSLSARLVGPQDSGQETRIEVSWDFSKFKGTQPLSGYVTIQTSDDRSRTALVPVTGKFIDPASIEPEVIVIGSQEDGDIDRDVKVKTSGDSRIRSAVCSGSDRVRVRYDTATWSREHRLGMVVPPFGSRPMDAELVVELEILGLDGSRIPREVRLPVHRFSQEGGRL